MRGAPQPAARGAAGEGTRTQSGARNVWRARRARIESRAAGPGARVAPPHQTPRAPLARAFRPGHRRARKKGAPRENREGEIDRRRAPPRDIHPMNRLMMSLALSIDGRPQMRREH